MRAVNRQPWFPREGRRYGLPVRNLKFHMGILEIRNRLFRAISHRHRQLAAKSVEICQKLTSGDVAQAFKSITWV